MSNITDDALNSLYMVGVGIYSALSYYVDDINEWDDDNALITYTGVLGYFD